MQAAVAAMVLAGIQFLIKEAPVAVNAIRNVINKKDPTDADFEAAKQEVQSATYEKLVPYSRL